MCMLFLTFNRGRFKLIVVSQRDEELDRPTAEAQWRDDILAGYDMKDPAQGTWFGVNRKGRVGVVLSITQPRGTKHQSAPSRGAIVKEYLASNERPLDYCGDLANRSQEFNGFQFIAINPEASSDFSMWSVTNMFVDQITVRDWRPETHVIGNSPPEIPFEKTKRGDKIWNDALEGILDLEDERQIAESLLEAIDDDERCFPDPQLAVQTGLPEDHPFLEPLSSLRIVYPKESGIRYGTRSYTVLLIDEEGSGYLLERRLVGNPIDPHQPKWDTVEHWFDVEKPQ
ncbi:unnamed protein product, partial [Mesorhabditis belari]|uniref:Uncharacterized protein n=1 Tax=Mesorhabditis belari TaxID=2138241 RepID=A0AAF3FGD9_9BILA